MSILIRGMELPKSCEECSFCVNGFTEKAPLYECACESTIGTSVPVDYDGKPFEFRPDWCPLEEVAECGGAVSRRRLLSDLKELIVAWEKYPVMAEQIKGVEVAIGYVETIPSVKPKQRTGEWIPVAKRLPERAEDDLEYSTVLVCFDNGEVDTACFYESTREWGCGDMYDCICHPIAWMPLPEPYKEVTE